MNTINIFISCDKNIQIVTRASHFALVKTLITLDENIYGIHSKRVNILSLLHKLKLSRKEAYFSRSIWAAMCGNVPSVICAQRRQINLSIPQSNQSLRYPHEESLYPWQSKMCLVKILIRLRKCAVWSESSLGAHVRWYVFWHYGSFHDDFLFHYRFLRLSY